MQQKLGAVRRRLGYCISGKCYLHLNAGLSSHASVDKSQGVLSLLSLPVLRAAEDARTREGFGHPTFLALVVAGCVLGSGLSAAETDKCLLKPAYCEGESLLVHNQLSTAGLGSTETFRNRLRLFSDGIRRRIFFMYERRIRAYSSPQKVFEYFASIRDHKSEYFMTPGDLLRALIPVLPPSESTIIRGGYLVGERPPGHLHCSPSDFFMLFDIDADGKISFDEYIFMRTLLLASLESFTVTFKMFDRDGNGTIDEKEFDEAIRLVASRHKERISYSPKINKLRKYLFGEHGERVLHHTNFMHFLKQLHEEIIQLEFSHYDCKQHGSIPAQDFGSSMVAAAPMSKIKMYLDRVDGLAKDPKFRSVRISYEDFQQFAELRKRRRLLALSAYSFKSNHGFSKVDFQWAVSQVCEVSLSETVVDIIFYIFDSNGDGRLSLSEFIGLQDMREIHGADPLQPGLVHVIRCMWQCAKNSCCTGVQ